MAKVRPQYLAFNRGELDSDTLARADLDTYHRGAEVMENITPLIQGGMAKAPGTRFIGEMASTGVLRPFIVSETDRLALEMTDNKIRFVSGDGYVQVTSPAVTLGSWTDESAVPDAGGGTAPTSPPPTDTGGGCTSCGFDYVPPGGVYP